MGQMGCCHAVDSYLNAENPWESLALFASKGPRSQWLSITGKRLSAGRHACSSHGFRGNPEQRPALLRAPQEAREAASCGAIEKT